MTKYSVFLLSFILAWGMIGCRHDKINIHPTIDELMPKPGEIWKYEVHSNREDPIHVCDGRTVVINITEYDSILKVSDSLVWYIDVKHADDTMCSRLDYFKIDQKKIK